MPNQDWSQLAADVADWLNNDSAELAAQIPSIIMESEDQAAKELYSHRLDAVAAGAVGAGVNVVPIPADMLQPRFLRVSSSTGMRTLLFRDYTFVTAYQDAWTAAQAQGLNPSPDPVYYAIQDGGSYVVAPTNPAAGMTYSLPYKARPARLSITAPANVLSQTFYEGLRWLALSKAAVYVIDDRQDGLVAKYESKYKAALAAANSLYPRQARDEYRALTSQEVPLTPPGALEGTA